MLWYSTVKFRPHPQKKKPDPFFTDMEESLLCYTKISRVLRVRTRARMRARLSTGVFLAYAVTLNQRI